MDNTNNIECNAKDAGMFLCRRKPAIVHFIDLAIMTLKWVKHTILDFGNQ